ncbi:MULTISPECIES: hypothetical protein [Chryseobacterium]|uniref:DUF4292 domain-containing protein n=1 Tax=Chryseobacterium camelliae TaxID=1265445 RepID=A0ABU0TLK2_9FLAO|nr:MULTISPECIES: hypothetical protein [Chryseobacterium]MDT3408218.1 hypothetical protein [Pseudacidovorax intermedius]MDQ1097928.1 hypothetical protein [Chryseobacterium camelliae]MDQ1101859.1 hypothetical protein [Chryseobacterium sp. SORGH_AS_1048]MDR6085299.1 hypothetical protein [Chryseobacterium sp. SORGH_AS_0909]MDR6129656.1 hypothetical protein [Chryseobacterium sp. SORGH_AS_1175]
MHRFLRQSFLYSILFLGLISCTTYKLSDVKPASDTLKTAENLYFSSGEDYVYKCQMDIYSNHVSGILIIKKTENGAHRVALTSDFGNKLIDFTISDTDFKINYVIPDLDRKIIINFLKNDFRKLLKRQYPVNQTFENEQFRIYMSKAGREQYYLFFDKETNMLRQIVYTEKDREKIDFTFGAKKHIFADSIQLQHRDYKISIRLFQISETE